MDASKQNGELTSAKSLAATGHAHNALMKGTAGAIWQTLKKLTLTHANMQKLNPHVARKTQETSDIEKKTQKDITRFGKNDMKPTLDILLREQLRGRNKTQRRETQNAIDTTETTLTNCGPLTHADVPEC